MRGLLVGDSRAVWCQNRDREVAHLRIVQHFL